MRDHGTPRTLFAVLLITLAAIGAGWFWALSPLSPLAYLTTTGRTDSDLIRHVWHFRLVKPEWVGAELPRWAFAETIARLVVVWLGWFAGSFIAGKYFGRNKGALPGILLRRGIGGSFFIILLACCVLTACDVGKQNASSARQQSLPSKRTEDVLRVLTELKEASTGEEQEKLTKELTDVRRRPISAGEVVPSPYFTPLDAENRLVEWSAFDLRDRVKAFVVNDMSSNKPPLFQDFKVKVLSRGFVDAVHTMQSSRY